MSLPDSIVQAIEKWAKQREEAAFQRGWKACSTALIAAAAKQRVPDTAELPLEPRQRERLADPIEAALVEDLANGTNRDRIAFALRARPGMKASEVHGALAAMGLQVNEQSILTTIKRMRSDGDIEKRGSELYLKARKVA